MAKAIIFGVSGQDGYYLQALLEEKGLKVIGVSRSAGNLVGNVADYNFVTSLIRTELPDFIFHLAANSSTRHDLLFENHQSITTGTLNILEAVRIFSPHCRIFLSGSALQFQNDGTAIDENTPFIANSAYAMSRIQSIYAGRYYRTKFGLKIFIGYFFNHDSPLRTEQHINQKIVAAVKRIKDGSLEKISIGDINARKEFSFAGDIVNAIWILINQTKVFEAVIGSGIDYSIKDWISYCFQKIGKDWHEYVINTADYKPDYNVLLSNPKLIRSLGWKPVVDIWKLADLMLN